MKHIILFSVLATALFYLNSASAGSPRVYFAYNTFLTPANGPYIETYLQFDASSLTFVPNENNQFQAAVEILFVFKQEEKIKDFRKYELKSPAIADPAVSNFSFTDQQRFLLPNGEYTVEITLTDLNKTSSTLNHSENITLIYETEKISVSSVQLVERIEKTETAGPLTKSGYNIVPFVDYFYPSSAGTVSFYAEIYNAAQVLGENEGILITSGIETFETKRSLPDFNRFKRDQAKPVNMLLNTFDISKLPSGNYFLVVSIKDKLNTTLASNRVFFQRSNPELKLSAEDFRNVNIVNSFAGQIVEYDSLAYFIKALGPISTYSEREFAQNLVLTRDIITMQQYFYNFWMQRDPAQPQTAWKNYYIEMCRADANFKTRIKRGYETDRGRVYLQYGAPNSISQSYNEPNAFPYEIWHYYSINGQRDKRFVFYTRDFATNDFELLHSDVVGELANHRWNLMLHDRHSPYWNVDTDNTPDHWGGRSRDYYNQPR